MGKQKFDEQSCSCEPSPSSMGYGYSGPCPSETGGSWDQGVAAFCAACEADPCAECEQDPKPYSKTYTYPGPSQYGNGNTVSGGIGTSLCYSKGILTTYECYLIFPTPPECLPPPPPPPTPPPVPTDCLNGGGTDGEDIPPWEGGGQQDD
jgi:hypothetical protein